MSGYPARPAIERFEEKFIPEALTGCWLWTASVDQNGYGQFWTGLRTAAGNKRPRKAHQASFEIYIGPIPDGMSVCHRCDVPACVNPAHLFLGSTKDNALDMVAKGRCRAGWQNAVKTHCKSGHPLVGDNVYVDANGHRHCKACAVIFTRKYKTRKKEQQA